MSENKRKMTMQELEKILGYKVQIVDKKLVELENVSVGETFKFRGVEFVSLANTSAVTYVITRDLVESSVFDSATNNYDNSMAQRKVNAFITQLTRGYDKADPIVRHEVDLTSLDGRNDYGKCDNLDASLLTIQQYRKFHEILDKYPVDKDWFLSTALSTSANGCKDFVCFINHRINTIDIANIADKCSVRPFLVLRNDTMVEIME